MIVYIPTPITSVEQAEALPVGTIAYIDVISGPARYSAAKTPAGDWYIGGREYHESSEMARWFALVPIEAEEETRGGPLDNDWDWDNGPASPPPPTPATRLVTPWESVDGPSPDRRGDCA